MLAEVVFLWLDKTGVFLCVFVCFFNLTSLPFVAREGTASPRAMAVDQWLMEAEEDRGNILDPRE